MITGWTNFVLNLKSKNAIKKAGICFYCEHKKKGSFEIIQENKILEIKGLICNLCKCPLSAKLRSDSKCPLNKF